jgi:5-formyltetrahydrofolate cyclo-ligase
LNKADLRKSIGERLRTLPTETRHTTSQAICASLVALPEFQAADTVLLFAPLPPEPEVELLWELPESHGKRFVYPRIVGAELGLYEIRSPLELKVSRWGLREPPHDPDRWVAPTEIDFVVVPGVAFTRNGERLGRGGGYYDRLLTATTRAFKTGVCFDFQVLPQLPSEPHDIAVDRVLTGRGRG